MAIESVARVLAPAAGRAVLAELLRRRPLRAGLLRRRRRSTSASRDASTTSTRSPALPLNRCFYLSTAPTFFPVIVDALGRARPRTGARAPRSASIIEKPFGTNARGGARAQRARARRSSTSGRSSASTTTSARRRSRTCWRCASPTACSSRCGTATTSTTSRSPPPRTSAIGSRAGYYDKAGALRDLVQNHMLQLLSLLCMEPPVAFYADAVRDEKVKVLHAISAPQPEEVPDMAVRAPVRALEPSPARRCRATSTRRASRRTRTPRRTPRCAWRSTTGAGPACRSTCARASAWRARSPRSR